MSTRLTKPVTRLVEIDGKPMNVTITATGVEYREYKRRTAYLLPHGSAFVRAVTLYVEQQRREKGKGRKRKITRGSL